MKVKYEKKKNIPRARDAKVSSPHPFPGTAGTAAAASTRCGGVSG